jgi:hypothetical protein
MLAAKAVSEFKKSGYFVIPDVIDAVLNRRLIAFVGGLAKGGHGGAHFLYKLVSRKKSREVLRLGWENIQVGRR